jgi:hypothetical protein
MIQLKSQSDQLIAIKLVLSIKRPSVDQLQFFTFVHLNEMGGTLDVVQGEVSKLLKSKTCNSSDREWGILI